MLHNTLNTLKTKKSSKKGFTLMEMLIVVAIIAILVAIAIPTFNGALDSARTATDQANLRAAYAEASVDYLMDGKLDTTTIAYGTFTATASVDDNGTITVTATAGLQNTATNAYNTYSDGKYSHT